MILVVNMCSEKLHYLEFVKPIEDILKSEKFDFSTKHYSEISSEDLENAENVIICGTSLKDNGFVEDLGKFSWLKDFEKPVLGICAGFQILGLIFCGKLKKKTEIGFFHENFEKEFLGLEGDVEVYHLHNNYVSGWSKDWEVCSGNKFAQAVKHNEKLFYGVLFHPEVRNKNLILEFVKNG